MKILRTISRVIIGLVFIFSGVVKAIDPLGSAYKFHDYFHAFNLGFLNALSLALSIILCTAEFLSGFSVLTGFRFKTGMLGVFILLLIFTPVTFILALTNPVSDCGCFGDAIHLSNWQTFGKNLVLFALFFVLYSGRDKINSIVGSKTEWTVIAISTIVFFLFCLFNLRYLPVVDFLPYKTGVKIAEKMIIPEGVPADQYKTTFVYEKDGEKKEFNLTNYPATDTTWKFVDQKSVLIKKGYTPPIHDFSLTSLNGEDLTQKVLAFQGYTLLMVTKKISEAGQKSLSAGFKLGKDLSDKGISFFVLTSSGKDEAESYNNGLTFCSVDETTLKTMIRANPGYILIRDGRILKKWSWANVPEKEWFGDEIKKIE